jgi:hypothetical protein
LAAIADGAVILFAEASGKTCLLPDSESSICDEGDEGGVDLKMDAALASHNHCPSKRFDCICPFSQNYCNSSDAAA